jgi:signal peptidase I
MSEINNDNMASKQNNFIKALIEQVELVVIVFAIIVLVFSFAARICQVSGDSMKNTLYNGENVVVSGVLYTPKRGDIIVFHQTGEEINDYNEPIVKRVIGVAGDTVKVEHLKDGMRVTVTDSEGNSTVLEEDYIRYERPTYSDSITYVEEGTVFVMGDNRSDSSDSRSMRIGLVDTRRILGRVIVRVTPFSRFGTVD